MFRCCVEPDSRLDVRSLSNNRKGLIMSNHRDINSKIEQLENEIALLENQHDAELQLDRAKYELTKLVERRDIVNWMKSFNTRYHVTITFNCNLREDMAEQYTKDVLQMVSHEYFGEKMVKEEGLKVKVKRGNFSGLVIREYQDNGSVHYHILISDHPVFGWKGNRKKHFNSVLQEKCYRVEKQIYGESGKLKNVKPIDISRGLKVQDYYEDKLEVYLTKGLEKKSNILDFMAGIGPEGFAFENKSYVVPTIRRNHSKPDNIILAGIGDNNIKGLKVYLHSRDRLRSLRERVERRDKSEVRNI